MEDSKSKKRQIQLEPHAKSQEENKASPDSSLQNMLQDTLDSLESGTQQSPSTADKIADQASNGDHEKVSQVAAKEAEAISSPNLEAQLKELQYKVNRIVADTGEEVEVRAKALNELVTGEMIPFLRLTNTRAAQAKADEELFYYQQAEYHNRNQKADLIKQKFELITREYDAQNKQFAEKHAEISADEKSKREGLLTSFEEHISTIKCQLADQQPQDAEENEVVKENKMLQTKFEELKGEIDEKTVLMTKQLEEKEKTSNEIQSTLTSQIENQELELKKQIDLYKEQTKIKIGEEKELLKVLTDYKGRFKEFETSTKKSRQNFKQFEKEVKSLDGQKRELQKQKDREEKQLGVKAGQDSGKIDALEQAWEADKAELFKVREELKNECARLQEEIKQKQAAN